MVIIKIFLKKLKLIGTITSIKNFVESKELNFNIHRELGSNHLKQLHFDLKGKSTNESLAFTIKNSVDKKNHENVQRSFKLVHNYPINDNLKVKVKIYY